MNVHKDGPKIVFFNVLKNDNNLENILKKNNSRPTKVTLLKMKTTTTMGRRKRRAM